VGDTVVWVNKDSMAHTVTPFKVPSGATGFDSGMLAAGKSWSYKFTTPGEYVYKCTFHPWAGGRIIVKELP